MTDTPVTLDHKKIFWDAYQELKKQIGDDEAESFASDVVNKEDDYTQQAFQDSLEECLYCEMPIHPNYDYHQPNSEYCSCRGGSNEEHRFGRNQYGI